MRTESDCARTRNQHTEALSMWTHFWQWIIDQPFIIAAATVAIFTGKGLLWLVMPALIARKFRNRAKRAHVRHTSQS